jgi:hypothetical protein
MIRHLKSEHVIGVKSLINKRCFAILGEGKLLPIEVFGEIQHNNKNTVSCATERSRTAT